MKHIHIHISHHTTASPSGTILSAPKVASGISGNYGIANDTYPERKKYTHTQSQLDIYRNLSW